MLKGFGESIIQARLRHPVSAEDDFFIVEADLMLCDDYSMPRAVEFFEKMGGSIPLNKDDIIVTCEHFTPPSNLESANLQSIVRSVARKWKLKYFYDLGRAGVGPLVMLSEKIVKPGMLILGTNPLVTALGGLGCYASTIGPGDMAYLWRKGEVHLIRPKTYYLQISHPKPSNIDILDIAFYVLNNISEIDEYYLIEIHGDFVNDLSVNDRLQLAYFLSQKGASAVVIPPSAKLLSLLEINDDKSLKTFQATRLSESDFKVDLIGIEPNVVILSEPDLTVPVSQLKNFDIDVVVIGGTVSGTIENLRILDVCLRNKKISDKVRMFVYPGSSVVFSQALNEGIIRRLSNAGALICPPGRGAEGFGSKGTISDDERLLTNCPVFQDGVFGLSASEIFYASTKTCAASAITGKITSPLEVS